VSVSVETTDRDGAVLVALSGELDVDSTGEVEERLIAVEESAPQRIVIDLRELAFIDSTGLSLLINANRRAEKGGRRLTIVTGTGPSRRLLRTTGLDTRLDVVEGLPEGGERM
jgi:anti-sigma B factor antagonist